MKAVVAVWAAAAVLSGTPAVAGGSRLENGRAANRPGEAARAELGPGPWERLRAAERRAERLERRLGRAAVAPDAEMHGVVPGTLRSSEEERGTWPVPLIAGLAAGLLGGLLLRRRPRVIALVPYDPLAPPTPRRSSRRRLR